MRPSQGFLLFLLVLSLLAVVPADGGGTALSAGRRGLTKLVKNLKHHTNKTLSKLVKKNKKKKKKKKGKKVNSEEGATDASGKISPSFENEKNAEKAARPYSELLKLALVPAAAMIVGVVLYFQEIEDEKTRKKQRDELEADAKKLDAEIDASLETAKKRGGLVVGE